MSGPPGRETKSAGPAGTSFIPHIMSVSVSSPPLLPVFSAEPQFLSPCNRLGTPLHLHAGSTNAFVVPWSVTESS